MNNGPEQRRFVSLGYFILLYLGTVETRLTITARTRTMIVNRIDSFQKISLKRLYFTTYVYIFLLKLYKHRY